MRLAAANNKVTLLSEKCKSGGQQACKELPAAKAEQEKFLKFRAEYLSPF